MQPRQPSVHRGDSARQFQPLNCMKVDFASRSAVTSTYLSPEDCALMIEDRETQTTGNQ